MLFALLSVNTIALLGSYYMRRAADPPLVFARYAPAWQAGNCIAAVGTAVAILCLYGVWWGLGAGVIAALATAAISLLFGKDTATVYLIGAPLTLLALLVEIAKLF